MLDCLFNAEEDGEKVFKELLKNREPIYFIVDKTLKEMEQYTENCRLSMKKLSRKLNHKARRKNFINK